MPSMTEYSGTDSNFELRNIILVNRVTSMIEKFKLISENMTQMSFIAIYILFGYYPFTTEATTVGVTVVASLKLCTMQYKNIIDVLISIIIVLNLMKFWNFHMFYIEDISCLIIYMYVIFWNWKWYFQMKGILRVPDEGDSESTWWRGFWEYLMKGILRVPDVGLSESPSLGTLRIPFIMYSQNPLHQVLSESPSSGTLRIPFIRYSQNPILRVPDVGDSESTWCRGFWEYLMKGILRVPDEGDSESTWCRGFWEYMMKGILRVPDSQNLLHQVLSESPTSGTLRIPFIMYSQNPLHHVL
jgi:hypothetical protein